MIGLLSFTELILFTSKILVKGEMKKFIVAIIKYVQGSNCSTGDNNGNYFGGERRHIQLRQA